ncbi:MAG TPA: hypothetical protein VNS46_04470 [Nocardioides sp.]|nr:hypothetical protein [Nocardioides sp.]
MMRLLAVELRRYLRRRAVVLLLAACVVVPVVIGVTQVYNTRPLSDEAVADAQAQVERDRANPDYQQTIDDCIAHPGEWGVGGSGAAAEEQCRAQIEPQLDWYLYRPVLDLDDEQDDSGVAIASLLAILLLLAGTTFTGHDWNSGSVSNQLLFEPRRERIWAAKAIVVTGAALVVAAVVMTAYWSGLGLVASSRDVLGEGQLLDAYQMGWRAAGVAAAASLLGYALTMLFRSTVATIGILLGASVAGSLLLFALGVSERWNPAVNLAALIENGTTYYSENACAEAGDHAFDDDLYYEGDYCEIEVSFGDGALYTGTFLVLAAAASFVSFRRRDVP